jgi:hypothetical protein
VNNEQIETLIQALVNEVMKRLAGEKNQLKTSQPKALDLALIDESLTIALDPKREKFSPEYLEILDKYAQNTAWTDSAAKSDLLVLHWLNFNRMTYLANLQSMDDLTELILEFLLKKKPVLLLAWEYKLIDIKKTSRFGLWRNYDAILEKLESYGVEFIQSPRHLSLRLEKEKKQKLLRR